MPIKPSEFEKYFKNLAKNDELLNKSELDTILRLRSAQKWMQYILAGQIKTTTEGEEVEAVDNDKVDIQDPGEQRKSDLPSEQPAEIGTSLEEKQNHAKIYASQQLLAKILRLWGEIAEYFAKIDNRLYNFLVARSMYRWKSFTQIHPVQDLLAIFLHHWKKVVRLQQIVSGKQILTVKAPGSNLLNFNLGHSADDLNHLFVDDTELSICDSDTVDMNGDSITLGCFPCMPYLVKLAAWLGADLPSHAPSNSSQKNTI
jgi:hypothetical protein